MTDSQCREAFEKWYKNHMDGLDEAIFDKNRNCYTQHSIHLAWCAWNARAEPVPDEAMVERVTKRIRLKLSYLFSGGAGGISDDSFAYIMKEINSSEIAKVAIAAMRGDTLRAAAVQALEALKVIEQQIMEVRGAQREGANWYTKGASGLFQQVRMWLDKSDKALNETRAALETALKE